MADPITDGFSSLAELLDEIEEIGIIAQIGVSLGVTLFALIFTRYIPVSYTHLTLPTSDLV